MLALCAAACGSTSKEGSVGETLTDGKLKVTVTRVDREVPRPSGRDVTGLGTPSAGMRFFGANVRACNGPRGPAIGPYSFELDVSGGGDARLRFPQRAYEDDFDSVREGCGQGWIVFEVPASSTVDAVKFKYDDTASAAPSDRREKHARFRWEVSAG